SPTVRAGDGEGDAEPDAGVLLPLEVAGEDDGRPAREPGVHQGGGGAGALGRVVRLKTAPAGAELAAAQSSEHGKPVSGARRLDQRISRKALGGGHLRGPRRPAGLVDADLVAVLQGEPDVVEAVQQPMVRVIVQLERLVEVD